MASEPNHKSFKKTSNDKEPALPALPKEGDHIRFERSKSDERVIIMHFLDKKVREGDEHSIVAHFMEKEPMFTYAENTTDTLKNLEAEIRAYVMALEKEIKKSPMIIMDFSNCDHVSSTFFNALLSIKDDLKKSGVPILLANIDKSSALVMESTGYTQKFGKENVFVKRDKEGTTMEAALEKARNMLDSTQVPKDLSRKIRENSSPLPL